MTFNSISANFLSRTLAGTATLVTLLGMTPGLAQASSEEFSAKNNGLSVKIEESLTKNDADSLEQMLANPNKMLAQPMYESANSLMEEEDFEGAILQYNMAIQFYPEYAEAYTNRAIAKAQLGDESGAISDLEQAASLFQEQGNTEAYQQIQQVLQQVQ